MARLSSPKEGGLWRPRCLSQASTPPAGTRVSGLRGWGALSTFHCKCLSLFQTVLR